MKTISRQLILYNKTILNYWKLNAKDFALEKEKEEYTFFNLKFDVTDYKTHSGFYLNLLMSN